MQCAKWRMDRYMEQGKMGESAGESFYQESGKEWFFPDGKEMVDG